VASIYPRPASPAEPVLPLEEDIHLYIKKIVVQELGIRVADKGIGETIPAPTQRK